VTTPNPDTTDDALDGISCVSSSDCWAAGGGDGIQDGFFLHWDGTSWTFVAMPSTPGLTKLPEAIWCVSANECWALGTGGSSQPGQPFVAELWNGQSWSSEMIANAPPSSPHPGFQGSVAVNIPGMTCTAATTCFAVGSYPDPLTLESDTLVEELS
jgi:hypothetical protein